MKLVPLYRGRKGKEKLVVAHAMVDDEDYDFLMNYTWSMHHKHNDPPYARRIEVVGRRSIYHFMHRQILGLMNYKLMCDHVDGNGLNNQRANLRVVTNGQNQMNRSKKMIGTTSAYKGVWKVKRDGKWQARVQFNKKYYHVGVFKTEEEAARAYDKKATELFGDFARLNFSQQSIVQ